MHHEASMKLRLHYVKVRRAIDIYVDHDVVVIAARLLQVLVHRIDVFGSLENDLDGVSSAEIVGDPLDRIPENYRQHWGTDLSFRSSGIIIHDLTCATWSRSAWTTLLPLM